MIADNLPVVQAERLPSPQLIAKAERATDLARHATAERTRKAYLYEFAAFEQWCREHDAPSLPTTSATLATYLSDLHHRGRAPASLGLIRAAVLWAHRQARLPLDSRAEEIRVVIAGARRERKQDPRRVKPLMVAGFLELRCSFEGSLIRAAPQSFAPPQLSIGGGEVASTL